MSMRLDWTLGLRLVVLFGLGKGGVAPDVVRVGAFSDQDPSQATPDGWTPSPSTTSIAGPNTR